MEEGTGTETPPPVEAIPIPIEEGEEEEKPKMFRIKKEPVAGPWPRSAKVTKHLRVSKPLTYLYPFLQDSWCYASKLENEQTN
jgi:hypothetical protein